MHRTLISSLVNFLTSKTKVLLGETTTDGLDPLTLFDAPMVGLVDALDGFRAFDGFVVLLAVFAGFAAALGGFFLSPVPSERPLRAGFSVEGRPELLRHASALAIRCRA